MDSNIFSNHKPVQEKQMNLIYELTILFIAPYLLILNTAVCAYIHKDDRKWYDWIPPIGFVKDVRRGILSNKKKYKNHARINQTS